MGNTCSATEASEASQPSTAHVDSHTWSNAVLEEYQRLRGGAGAVPGASASHEPAASGRSTPAGQKRLHSPDAAAPPDAFASYGEHAAGAWPESPSRRRRVAAAGFEAPQAAAAAASDELPPTALPNTAIGKIESALSALYDVRETTGLQLLEALQGDGDEEESEVSEAAIAAAAAAHAAVAAFEPPPQQRGGSRPRRRRGGNPARGVPPPADAADADVSTNASASTSTSGRSQPQTPAPPLPYSPLALPAAPTAGPSPLLSPMAVPGPVLPPSAALPPAAKNATAYAGQNTALVPALPPSLAPSLSKGSSVGPEQEPAADPSGKELTRKPWLALEDQTIVDSVETVRRWGSNSRRRLRHSRLEPSL